MDAKEEVRARLNIEDVIGEYVQLKRAGRSFKGLSPFTSEKTPSFFVSPDKNIWHDFSSNKGGDVFAFVMEAEGMDFRQALEFLAKKAGVELSDYEPAHAKERAMHKKRLQRRHSFRIMGQVQDFFHKEWIHRRGSAAWKRTEKYARMIGNGRLSKTAAATE